MLPLHPVEGRTVVEEPKNVRRGRSARIAARTAAVPEVNPAPPGQRGGWYAPLREAEIRVIYATAPRLPAELGKGNAPPKLIESATDRGAEVNALGRLAFPRVLVEDIIAGACKSFVFHGRDPRHDFEVGHDRV